MRPHRRVAVMELVAYTVASEWASPPGVLMFKRQLYGIMPQAVSAWARALGHRVSYAVYYGQSDPFSLLPDDVDIVFVTASTQASALAYALAKLLRTRGVLTVIGGPHAKCFPEDCRRFFDITVTQCDRTLVEDILAGRIDPPAIVASTRPPAELPSVEERLPELADSALDHGHPMRSSVIGLIGSLGCPYGCGFCTDWDSPYQPFPAEALRRDLAFISKHLAGTIVGFHDPNFGLHLDRTLSELERVPRDVRSPYLMQCSLAALTPKQIRRLGETGCLYVAPGIESWSEFGKKTRLAGITHEARLLQLTAQFTALRAHVRGLQANFVFGLDSDAGEEPFALTRSFFTELPFVWPNLNLLTPYGGTPVYRQLADEKRLLLAMPLALYCSPYLCYIPRNYDALEFYRRLISLFEASVSAGLTLRRVILRDHAAIKLSRFAQTVAVRRDTREMRQICDALKADARMRDFHAGRTADLPTFYRQHVARRLGRYVELLLDEELHPLPPVDPRHASDDLPAQGSDAGIRQGVIQGSRNEDRLDVSSSEAWQSH